MSFDKKDRDVQVAENEGLNPFRAGRCLSTLNLHVHLVLLSMS